MSYGRLIVVVVVKMQDMHTRLRCWASFAYSQRTSASRGERAGWPSYGFMSGHMTFEKNNKGFLDTILYLF